MPESTPLSHTSASLPAIALVGASDSDCPHGLHSSVQPATEYVPTSQLRHSDWPTVACRFPAGQSIHAVMPPTCAKVPALHCSHFSDELPTVERK